MNRRTFFGALAGLLVVPGAAIAALFKPICPGNKHPNWMVGQPRCPDCGMAFSAFWKKKFGHLTRIRYKRTRHYFQANGATVCYDHFEPLE